MYNKIYTGTLSLPLYIDRPSSQFPSFLLSIEQNLQQDDARSLAGDTRKSVDAAERTTTEIDESSPFSVAWNNTQLQNNRHQTSDTRPI